MSTKITAGTPRMEPTSRIILPLYIYPVAEKTWQPLYNAISSYPNVDFLVVVNPNSGPGDASLPGHDYMREVPKLNSYANVTTVGYALIDYCRRPLSDVFSDINTYAAWAAETQDRSLGVEGIFLDETPNHYSKERAEYLQAVGQHIKTTGGILGDRLVIHNPGTPPDASLMAFGPGAPDVIVTCEEPYGRYRGNEVQKRLKEYPCDWNKCSYMISAVPRDEMGSFVHELRHSGAYLYATDLVENFYESFGSGWDDFVAAMGTA